MGAYHKIKEIENYEEYWQKICYFKSGDGVHYIHSCELCGRTESGTVQRIPGGHYLCSYCKKKMRLPLEKTILKWGRAQKDLIKRCEMTDNNLAEPSKRTRYLLWRKLIKTDYLIEKFNRKDVNKT